MTDTTSTSPDDRCLPLQGAVNFRDLGGNETTELRCVKRGLVFRSDHLSRLSDGDQRILQRLGFKVVCDLRSSREQQRAPDRLPSNDSIRLLLLPVQDSIFDPATALERLKAGDDAWLSMDFLVGLYRRYLDEFGPVWGKVLGLAASVHNLPLVFHCTGGKDRTGICAALLLLALGVSEERILSDHVLSDACNGERLRPLYATFARLGVEPEKAAYHLSAPEEPLVGLFHHLKKRYGSIEDYLLGTAKMDRSVLKGLRSLLVQ